MTSDLFYWARFKNLMAAGLCLVSNSVQSHTQLLHSGRICCLGFMVNVNTLKKDAARFFRNLTATTRLHGVILRTPTERSFSCSRFCYEGML